MRYVLFLIFLYSSFLPAQQETPSWTSDMFLNPEIFIGKTMKAYNEFPPTRLHSQAVLNFLWRGHNPEQQWPIRLKRPEVGFSMGITDFGNHRNLGLGISLMPIIEFGVFGSEKWTLKTGLGASYISKKFHPETNSRNKAVTTDFTWAYRMVLYYRFIRAEKTDWRIGLGYSHHSNGHYRLMNNGINSFFTGISVIPSPINPTISEPSPSPLPLPASASQYVSLSTGMGYNVLAEAFNTPKAVNTISAAYGWIFTRTYKVGIGFYGRYYKHYYDYIRDNESLVQDGRGYGYFKENPFYYATNLGISVHGEIILNHVGINMQLGYNFHKPGYKLEYQLNNGWENTPRNVPETWKLGELNTYYQLKYRISSRLGLRYYFFGMEKTPKNNYFIGIHLNANLGQADFGELSFGYIHTFKKEM